MEKERHIHTGRQGGECTDGLSGEVDHSPIVEQWEARCLPQADLSNALHYIFFFKEKLHSFFLV